MSFAVHKLAKFSSNSGKEKFRDWYIGWDTIEKIGLWAWSIIMVWRMWDLSDLSRKANIKTENQFTILSDYNCQYFLDPGRSTVVYIIFFQVGIIEHSTYFTGLGSQSSAESKYNTSCTEWMELSHFSMLIHELLNKNIYIVSEEAPLIIFDRKSAVYIAKNGKGTKCTRHISKIVHFWEMLKNVNNIRLAGVKEVCNFYTPQLIIL